MRKVLSILTLLVMPVVANAGPAPAAKGVDWELDTAHSRVGFSVKHLAVTNVRGEFKEFAAPVLKADATTGALEAFEATVTTKTIDTNNDKRDEHLRSDDFFNAEKFPQMKIKLKSIKWSGDKFTAECDVTIRDKTKTVAFEGEKSAISKVNFGNGPQMRVGYSVSGKVNRKEFGLMWAKAIEAVPVVSDDVKLDIEIEMFKKG